eukprot:scaffold1539_cov191-Alexandrium_tamarense.AAC.8
MESKGTVSGRGDHPTNDLIQEWRWHLKLAYHSLELDVEVVLRVPIPLPNPAIFEQVEADLSHCEIERFG